MKTCDMCAVEDRELVPAYANAKMRSTAGWFLLCQKHFDSCGAALGEDEGYLVEQDELAPPEPTVLERAFAEGIAEAEKAVEGLEADERHDQHFRLTDGLVHGVAGDIGDEIIDANESIVAGWVEHWLAREVDSDTPLLRLDQGWCPEGSDSRVIDMTAWEKQGHLMRRDHVLMACESGFHMPIYRAVYAVYKQPLERD